MCLICFGIPGVFCFVLPFCGHFRILYIFFNSLGFALTALRDLFDRLPFNLCPRFIWVLRAIF